MGKGSDRARAIEESYETFVAALKRERDEAAEALRLAEKAAASVVVEKVVLVVSGDDPEVEAAEERFYMADVALEDAWEKWKRSAGFDVHLCDFEDFVVFVEGVHNVPEVLCPWVWFAVDASWMPVLGGRTYVEHQPQGGYDPECHDWSDEFSERFADVLVEAWLDGEITEDTIRDRHDAHYLKQRIGARVLVGELEE